MAKVLRGGKWGFVPSRSNSRSEVPSRSEASYQALAAFGVKSLTLFVEKRVLISFVEEKKHLGVAVYDSSVNSIFISRVSCADDYHNASRIVSMYDQCYIVLPIPYQDNEGFISAIRPNFVPRTAREQSQMPNSSHRPSTANSGTVSDSELENSISFIPSTEFSLNKAKELCSLVTVGDMPKNLTPESRLLYLSHVLGSENVIIRSVGGLLSCILQQGVLGALRDDSDEIRVNGIHPKNYNSTMRLSPNVSQALQIFSHELHPLGRGGLRGKEGVSLFGILKDHVKTAAGRHLLRSWLMYPSTDLNEIQDRQVCVQSLRNNSRRALLTTIRDALSGVKNVEGILGRVQKHSTIATDWKAFHSSTSSFIFIIEALKTAAQEDERFSRSSPVTRALRVNESHLREPTRWIESAVDFEECRATGRMVVAPGFSAEIDDLKRMQSGLDDFLTKVGIDELEKMAENTHALRIRSFHFKYVTQIGFLIAVPDQECEDIGIERFEEHGMSFRFKSDDDGYHFKNQKCHDLDEEVGDIGATILELEEHACRYLEAKLLDYAFAVTEMASIVKTLDCLQAFAVAANEYSWTAPVLVSDDHGLEIVEGRHPLMELMVPAFVPNSTRIRLGDVHVLSGKSARMVIIDSINGRISALESMTSGSMFFTDASQVARMFGKQPGRSLNLLDEFGIGTAGVDGMNLLASVIHELATTEDKMSITLCATNFVEMLGDQFLPLSNPRMGLFSMEVQTRQLSNVQRTEPPKSRRRTARECRRTLHSAKKPRIAARGRAEGTVLDLDNTSDIIRTYRLLPGSLGHESRALHCALEAQVPRFILQRAAHLRDVISRGETVADAPCVSLNSSRIKALSDDIRAFLRAKLEDDSPTQS
ncbi:DNA mismatch repair protein MutS [Gracilaria domingensis]|nr:DNA mismatch repair protein MutS [Gracilaria domingensis]